MRLMSQRSSGVYSREIASAVHRASDENSILQKLNSFGSLTFFKDYRNTAIANADYAVGSPTATFTANRDATTPATYVDGSGVIQLVTTANAPRFAGGYYDATGFHAQKGLMIEGARTNLLTRTDGTASGSGLWTSWIMNGTQNGTVVSTNTAIPELCGISGAKSQRTQYTGVTGDSNEYLGIVNTDGTGVGSVVNTNVCTVSAWIRSKTGNTATVNVVIGFYTLDGVGTPLGLYESSSLTASITSSWRKFTYTDTVTDAAASIATAGVYANDVDDGNVVDFEVYGIQFEKSPYASSFIPTTTAALTRNAEVLKYVISGNRTGATESCFIKYAPSWAAASQSGAVYLADTDADIVDMAFVVASDSFQYRPNGTDDAAVVALAASDPAINTSYVMAGISYGATAGTNAEIYVDGVSKGTSTTNYTEPDMAGTDFYIGAKADGSLQLDGLIQAVAFFSDAKSATDVASITGILQ